MRQKRPGRATDDQRTLREADLLRAHIDRVPLVASP
jgi:hypothetical protein